MSSFEASTLNTTISQHFAHIAKTYAKQLAIHTSTTAWTYDELNQRANQIAHRLLQHCGLQQAQIGILCSDVLWQVAALLAVIKTGKTVVMLDLALPDQRLSLILEDAQTEAVLFDDALTARANAIAQTTSPLSTASIEENKPIQPICVNRSPASTPAHNPDIIYEVDNPLSITYTSGSSGQPKGIVRSHKAQMQGLWANQQQYQTTNNANWAITSSLAYAAAFAMTMRALVSGGCIHYYDAAIRGSNGLTDWLHTQHIHYFSPALTFLKQWCHDLPTPIYLPHLQMIFLVGTTLHTANLVHLKEKVIGNYNVVNNYGATEFLSATYYRVNIKAVDALQEGIVPVGIDMPNKQTLIYAANGDQVAPGQIGEIVIKSRYMAKYWRSSQLNQEKFWAVPDEPGMYLFFTGDLGYQDSTGCLWLTGRKDFMVKIRGYRVDLSEIEYALIKMPDIASAIVVAQPQPASATTEHTENEPILLAYILPKPNSTIAADKIQQNLSAHFPNHMLPRHVILLNQMPLLPNGKIDRQALTQRKVDFQRSLPAHAIAPRSALEAQLASIWASVLGINPIGINEVFLDLGGNSLQAMRIVAAVLDQLQTKISIQSLMASATIELMALAITQTQAAQIDPDMMDQLLTEIEQN
ncbi:MAG: non-ribosomal peptide synthetase [Anaerolineae bacterium]|nr:non-ribosomal peptide synthetase [Anaerolineae bacterium]